MREIKNVFVNGISLVSQNETPAVEQAENTFALFKTVTRKEYNENLEKTLKNLERRKLEKISDNLKKS